MNEEIHAHLDLRTQANIQAGMAPGPARQAALRQFGGVEATKEACRDETRARRLEMLGQDLWHAGRQLRKNPGFTAVALLTLALGIGANTGVFSVVDKLLVRPLPVSRPEELVLVGQPRRNGQADFDFNYPLYLDYKRDNTVFQQLAVTSEMDVGLGTGGATERHRAMVVSGNYFGMLGVQPALGRTFAANEGVEIDDASVLVLSHGLWVRRFGADPQAIGRTVTISGRPFTIIGVTPREFFGTSRASRPDIYLPITAYGQLVAPLPNGDHPLQSRFFTWLYMIGRLKDGVTRAQAQASLETLSRQIHAVTPANTSTNLMVLPGLQGFNHDLNDARLPLQLLLATSILVLLIACANLANLQLARATTRMRDFAIRLALGAGRGRLLRALLTESVLLSAVGGALGLLVAFWLVDALTRFLPANVSVEAGLRLDPRVLGFALLASVLTGILFGLAPAWRASRPQLVPELKGSAGATEARTSRWSGRNLLVVLQIALSLLVLISAGLCVRSLKKLQRLDPGFEPSKVVLISFDLGLNNYSKPQAKEFYDNLLERTRLLPGVESASVSFNTPLSGRNPGMSVERAEGYQGGPNEHPYGDFNVVSDGYFRTLGIPMLHGRDFGPADTATAIPVVIVNEAFARRYWPNQDPVGKRLYEHGPRGSIPVEVVGVVGSTSSRSLAQSPRQAFFFPATQRQETQMTLAVRTGLEPRETIASLRQLTKSLDHNVPLFDAQTMAQQKDGSLALQRMAAALLGGFGCLALLLAALGIYGVLAYSVSRRTQEIGVRMALGAKMSNVLGMVLRQGLSMAVIGLGLGLLGALGTTRVLRGFLYEVQPLDPLTFASVVALLGLVALLACWLPARRAAKVNPMVALRAE